MRRFILFAALSAPLIGCGNTEPTLSGGKPVGYWVRALKDPNPQLRKEAAFKLGNAGPVEDTVFPALVASLRDPDARVRCETVVAVVKFGPAAKEAVPVLSELKQKDPDARTRAYASRALEKLRD